MVWLKLSVILFLVCAVQCALMSNDELEDFQNFLKKTSQLDQTIRKGVDPDEDEDEDEAASDHAWEDSGKFEGDLILNDRQRRVIVQDVAEGLSRNGLRDSTKRWPNNEVIYYIQKDHFSGAQVEAIQNGIDDLAQASCIKFRPYKKGDRDAVVIQGSRRGCFSQVGYQSGYQVLNLSGRHPVGRGCFRHGTVVHELLHTLGFYHMQSSPDRDDFIDVVWENIRKQARHNFRKYNMFSVSDFGVGYDYDSVLHYSRRAFSTNGQDTLVPKKSGAEIGQRVGLSDKDTQKLNKMYCDADSDSNNADEDNTSKPLKKKKPKNKPFDGHGIGYHQGKTVVIKLLPAPETYKLPDVPSFHVFDYFSKAPQALSTPSEIAGFRTGKEVIYPYNSPATVKTEEYSKPQQFTPNTKGEDWKNYGKTTSANTEEYKKPQQDTVNINSENWSHDDKTISDRYNETSRLLIQDKNITNADENRKESPLEDYKPITASETLEGDLSDAFDSLTKIIKSHVYPSQTPNLNIYKIHKAHIELFNPSNYSAEKQVDGTLQEHTEKIKSGIEIITEIYDRSSIVASDTVNNSENVEDKKEAERKEKHSLSSDTDTVNPNKHNFYQGYPYRSFSYGVRGPFSDEYVAQKYETPEDDEHDDDEHEGYKGFEYYKEDNKSKEGPKSLFEDVSYKLYSEDSYRKPVFSRRFDDLRSTVHTPYTLQRSPYLYDDGDEAYGSSSDGQDTRSLFGYPGSSEQKWGDSDYSKGNLDLSSHDHTYR